MLRWFVLALAAANLLFWAWTQGWLGTVWGYSPMNDRDPSRLAQQVQPDLVRVLPPAAAQAALQAAKAALAAAPVASASAPQGVCLESGPLASGSIDAAEQALAAVLPERGWIRASREVAAQYGVVLGPFAGREPLARKGEELTRLRVSFEEVRLPAAPEGQLTVSLGRYDTQAAAQAALDVFAKRGVRTARVAALRAAGTEWRLRFENVMPDVAEQLRAANLPALGSAGLAPCAATSPTSR
ncbi:MAG: hypothetical protein OEU94_00360 [Aquincola sp.]|nr:hypothetical protein [Aquincola sp.]MDH4287117.1 hypothetical protein [Aquincola sp.]MDH5328707.1 hypothetical protein [Aquincola sp.]